MSMLHLLAALMPKGAAPLAIATVGSVLTSSANLTTYDFGNVTVPTDGLLVVVFTAYGDSSRSVSSMSIGGSAVDGSVTGTGSFSKSAIGWRVVSAGTQNVTVGLSGANGTNPGATAAVYLVTGYTSATPTDTDAPANAVAASYSASVDTLAGQVAVVGVVGVISANFTLSSATEIYDTPINNTAHAHGYIASTVAATPHTETATRSSGNTGGRVIIAVWS